MNEHIGKYHVIIRKNDRKNILHPTSYFKHGNDLN